MELVDELTNDHLRIAALLEWFGDLDAEGRRNAFGEVAAALTTHEFAEEKVVFPALASCAAGGAAIAADRAAEQHEAEALLGELQRTPVDDGEFEAILRRLRTGVTEHAAEEEATVFWVLRTNLPEQQRQVVAHQYARAKGSAPTRPHPLAPHGTARTALLGPVVSLVDRKRDASRDGRQSDGRRSDGSRDDGSRDDGSRDDGRRSDGSRDDGIRGVEADTAPASRPWGPTPDAVAMIRQDHRRIGLLLDQLERQAEAAPRWVLDDLARQVAQHTAAELELVYPLVAGADTRRGHDLVKQSRLDHEEVDMNLARMTSSSMTTAEFRGEALALVEGLRSHLAREEADLLPILHAALTADASTELARRLERVKRHAPRTPHAHAPKSAIGAKVTNRLLAAFDRLRPR